MAAALEHLTIGKRIATGYEDFSLASSTTRTKVSNRQGTEKELHRMTQRGLRVSTRT